MFEQDDIIAKAAEDPDFKLLLESTYFKFYEYKTQEFVLAVTSFSSADPKKALTDTLEMLKLIKAKQQNKLYISVIGNGGGWVSLGHLLANGLFHTEYPIYGRYNIRKSKLAELLLKGGSTFEDMHRFEVITGKTLTNASIVNATPSMDWYRAGDDKFT